jgi:vitamin B12 transporter
MLIDAPAIISIEEENRTPTASGLFAASVGETQIIVTGSRIALPPQLVEIGDAAKAVLAVDIRDLLDRMPGARAASTAGAGGTSFVSIRGAEPNFAQVTIDGVRVSNPSNSAGGGFDFAQLDPSAIRSVAIVPGSRSAVYGADALSGVIAVELQGPPGKGTQLRGHAGADTDEGLSGYATLGTGWSGGGLVVGTGAYDAGDLTPGSSLERQQLIGKLTLSLGAINASVFALHARTQREAFPESSGGPQFAVNRALESRDTELTIVGARMALGKDAPVVPSLRLGYSQERTTLDTPAIFPGVFGPVPALASDTLFERFELTGDARFAPARDLALVVGANYMREDAASTGTIDIGFPLPTGFGLARDQLALFAELGYLPATGPYVTAALRHDLFGNNSETTAQATLGWRFAEALEAYTSYSEGYKLPSLFALAFPLTANPDLLPERSKGWEAGISWRAGSDMALMLNAFTTKYTDLIDFDPLLFTTVNRGQVEISGLTASGEARLGAAIRLSGSASWLNVESEVPLRGRPDWSGYLRADWSPAPRWSVGAAVRVSDRFLESAIPTGVIPLKGYALFDLFGEWRLSEAISLSIALRNATDADYAEAVGFTAPGRTLRVRVGFDF